MVCLFVHLLLPTLRAYSPVYSSSQSREITVEIYLGSLGILCWVRESFFFSLESFYLQQCGTADRQDKIYCAYLALWESWYGRWCKRQNSQRWFFFSSAFRYQLTWVNQKFLLYFDNTRHNLASLAEGDIPHKTEMPSLPDTSQLLFAGFSF